MAIPVHSDAIGMSIVAAILAGGLGMRVRTLLPSLPKALAPIDGKPFISYLLDQVAAAGVERIVVCAGRRGDQLRRGLQHQRCGVPVVVCQEEWPLGTAGALRKALDYFDAETVLALNGDSYVDVHLARFCRWRESRRFESAVLLTWKENCAGVDTVEVDAAGKI